MAVFARKAGIVVWHVEADQEYREDIEQNDSEEDVFHLRSISLLSPY